MSHLYSVEYTYEGSMADKSFHFVHARSERVARVMVEEYIEELLELRFGKSDILFEIVNLELVK
ncbi:hypothetical protein [Actinobacillus vicugnae]|uniref:hypothetical protein n=1 Tax=Actinobacillus vicugnae TaxID=2573093 RepID=UPI001241958D|nr:hypothetical protein [Actinobacillus vicugnae]